MGAVLDKDPTIVAALDRLWLQLGQGAFVLVDHWDYRASAPMRRGGPSHPQRVQPNDSQRGIATIERKSNSPQILPADNKIRLLDGPKSEKNRLPTGRYLVEVNFR